MPTQTGSTIDHVIGPAGMVTLKVPSGGVTVQAIDGEAVRLSSPSGRDLSADYRIETGDGRLELSPREGVAGGFGWLTRPRFDPIHAEVPRGATVRLETASGSVHVDGLRGEQHYRAASGSIKLADVAGEVNIDHVSGDVKVRGSGPLSLVARTVSGDVNASAPSFDRIHSRTMSGSVRIAGRLVGAGPFAMESVSGDVSIELDGPAQIEGTSVAGSVRTDLPHRESGFPGRRTVEIGDGGPRVSFRTVSGDLRVTGPKARRSETDAAPAGAGPSEADLPDAGPADADPGGFAAATMPIPPTPPVAPIPPIPPMPPMPPTAPHPPDAPGLPPAPGTPSAIEALAARRLAILQDLEHGRIEVDEATERLAEIDAEEDRAMSRARAFDIGPFHGELRWDHRA